MKIINSVIYCLLLVAFNPVSGFCNNKIRKPAVAGTFYPSKSEELKSMIDDFIDVKSDINLNSMEIMGIIVPHAGYIYSGKTAGYGFHTVRDINYSKIILLGSSHNAYLEKPLISSFSEWETPLGKVNVDNKCLYDIASKLNIYVNNNIFIPEHSLEVEIPFLQRVLKGGFSIVPMLINEYRIEKIKPYADKLAEIFRNKKNFFFVMSTDMSHYYKADEALIMDGRISDALVNMDFKKMERYLSDKSGQLCGAGGVMLGLMTLKKLGATGIRKISYSHSGIVTGDNAKVVGYGSYVVYREKKEKNNEMGLNKTQKIKLLELARETIKAYVCEGKKMEFKIEDEDLKAERGVFVTIHKRNQLRGCIGNILPMNKLYLAVRDMAIQSATNDPRFTILKEEELDEIEIEISVLTVPEKVEDHTKIVLGRDGVIVKKGFHQGVYLPQVADETGWNKDEFLSSLCYSKAGLPPDAWKNPDTELYTFQAEVFNEKELGLR